MPGVFVACGGASPVSLAHRARHNECHLHERVKATQVRAAAKLVDVCLQVCRTHPMNSTRPSLEPIPAWLSILGTFRSIVVTGVPSRVLEGQGCAAAVREALH